MHLPYNQDIDYERQSANLDRHKLDQLQGQHMIKCNNTLLYHIFMFANRCLCLL